MSLHFDTVTIVGVGLLGGSLGLALKQRGLAGEVRGLGHRPESLRKALDTGAIDHAFEDIDPAVSDADLIVLCTPAALVPEYLDRIRPRCSMKTVVTDVASTKAEICNHAHKAWADPYRFIGSHPMAGSQKFGPEHAQADLYEHSVVFVERRTDHDPSAHATVCALWEALGAQVVPVDPAEHDRLVARTSHAPHVLAAALSQLIDGHEDIEHFIGNGFLDTTRIAEGRPEIWRDICLTNADAIGVVLDEIADTIGQAREAIRTKDADALQKFFEAGNDARRRADRG